MSSVILFCCIDELNGVFLLYVYFSLYLLTVVICSAVYFGIYVYILQAVETTDEVLMMFVVC